MRAPGHIDPRGPWTMEEWNQLYNPAPLNPTWPDVYELDPEPGLLGPDGEPLPLARIPFGFQPSARRSPPAMSTNERPNMISPADLIARMVDEEGQNPVPTTAEMRAHMEAGKLVEGRDAATGDWSPALISLSDFDREDDKPEDPQPGFRLIDAPGPAWQGPIAPTPPTTPENPA